MGTNSNSGQPAQYDPKAALQNAALQGLARTATTPYAGNASGGGAANAAAQLGAALMAKQRMQQWQQRNRVPVYGNPNAQPGQVTPGQGIGGFPQPPGQPLPQTMNGQPVAAPGAALA